MVLLLVHQDQEMNASSLPQLDLTIIAEQIIHKFSYEDWEGSRIESALEEYKKFLALCKTYPNTPIVPGRDVDTIWHQHILNTEKYADDCQSYFGYFLHHRPHSLSKLGTQEPNHAWLNTLRLYEEMFNSSAPMDWLDSPSICQCSTDGQTKK